MERNNVTVITYITLVVASLSLGFWTGQRANRRTENPTSSKPPASNRDPRESIVDNGDSEDSSESNDGDVSALKLDSGEDCKMVFVVRTDLGMSSGKMAAQCSHAALACYKTLLSQNPVMLRHWERAGQTKVALQCGSEDELLLMEAQAQSLKLCARSIQDAGRTQIAAGSRTVLGITGPTRLVNQITGCLRLL